MALVHPDAVGEGRDVDSCSDSSALDGDHESLSAPPSSASSADGRHPDSVAPRPMPKVVSGVQFRRDNPQAAPADHLHGLAARRGRKGAEPGKPPTRPQQWCDDERTLQKARTLEGVYKAAQNRTVAFKPRQPPQPGQAPTGTGAGVGGGMQPSRKSNGDITQTAARNKLQRRNLPAHVADEGNAERYYQELQQVLEQKARVEKECAEVSAKIAAAEGRHQKQVERTEALLQAQASLSKDDAHAARRVQLLEEQDYLKTLKDSAAAVAEQIREKQAVLADIKELSLATNVREMERQVRMSYADMLALQKKLAEADTQVEDLDSKHALSDALRDLQTKDSMAEQSEAKLRALIEKQEYLSSQVKQLAASLQEEKSETDEIQHALGEERKRLVHESCAYPPEIETLQAEILTAKNQKISTDAELQRTKHHYDVSMAQLSASMSDMQGRIDRWALKRELQTKKVAETSADLNAVTRQLHDLQQRQRLQREAFAAAAAAQQPARHTALEKAIAAERSRLVADVQSQEDTLAALTAKYAEQAAAHSREVEAVTKHLEERQRAVLDKIPFLGGMGDERQRSNPQEERRPKPHMPQEKSLLSARNGPEEHVYSPHSDAKSEVSHRAESAVTRVRIEGEVYDNDDVAESLCRGAGGTVLGGIMDDHMYDDEA